MSIAPHQTAHRSAPKQAALQAAPPNGADIVLSCEGVSHSFGPKAVLHDIHLAIARGQITALVGPSGSGKSTLLRAILGTHPPVHGTVTCDNKPVSAPGQDRGIVYQRYTLYPFLTALQNVAFGLLVGYTSPLDRIARPFRFHAMRKEHLARSEAMLVSLGLGKSLHQYPAEMSGGMCQRVAIAQALIMRPRVLLLDEPFGALDEATREELQMVLLKLYGENLAAKGASKQPPHTILIVTHELNEAIYVSDRVLGLSQYWQWEAEGHKACPGATIVYDEVAPVFSPTQPMEYDQLRAQRADIRRVVMEPEPRRARLDNVRFWQQVVQGKGGGMFSPAAFGPYPK